MKTVTLLILLSIFSCTSTKKSTGNADSTNSESSNLPAVYTGTNPFGILVNIADGMPPGIEKKVSVAKDLGVPYIRSTIALTGGTINFNEYKTFESNGFKVILNINYARQLMDGKTQVRTSPTNISEYKSLLTNAVADIKPELVAIENEENNLFYYDVDPQAYLKELGAAIEVLHAKGIKVTNGGIVSRTILLLVYEDYLNMGMKKEAADYASRAMIQDIVNDYPGLQNHKVIQKQMSIIKQLLEGYKKLPLDYVNFHWYEPVSGRGASQAPENIKAIDTRLLAETVTYFRKVTGKEVITTEIGQLNSSPEIVKHMMQTVLDLKMPYAIWYSGDGGDGKAVAVNNGDGSLRPYGIAFRDYLKGLK